MSSCTISNYCDLDFEQNNCDYDFWHNRTALSYLGSEEEEKLALHIMLWMSLQQCLHT